MSQLQHLIDQHRAVLSRFTAAQRTILQKAFENPQIQTFASEQFITNTTTDITPYLVVRGSVTLHVGKDEQSARNAEASATLREGDIIGFSHMVGHNPWTTRRIPVAYGKDLVVIAKAAPVDEPENESPDSSNVSKSGTSVMAIPQKAWGPITSQFNEFNSTDYDLHWNLSYGQLSSAREDINDQGARVIRVAFYDAKSYMRQYFASEAEKIEAKYKNTIKFQFKWIDSRVNNESAQFASNCPVVCTFVNDPVTPEVAQMFSKLGVKMVALRAAGFNSVNLSALDKLNISIARVPAYSPYAVAEFACTLLMTVNRKVHHAYNRTREYNFSLNRLVGTDMHDKTIGVIGTGKIGQCFINIMLGFGCKVLAYDVYPNEVIKKMKNVQYTTLEDVFKKSDAISLHVPLLKETKHIINAKSIALMKPNCILINTGRGALINSQDLINGLQQEKLAGAGLDVYEEEEKVFFEDHSEEMIQDNQLIQLVGLPNVVLTSHQAFLTAEALIGIANCTLENIYECIIEGKTMNELTNTLNKKEDRRKKKRGNKDSTKSGSASGSLNINKTNGRFKTNERMLSKL